MENLEQDQILFEKQYYEDLLALKNSCRQRLLIVGEHYELQKNKCNTEHKSNMKSLASTEELDKFFMNNVQRVPVKNSHCKLHSSGNAVMRNSCSANELRSLTDSELNVKKDLKKSSRPKSVTSAWTSQFTVPQPFDMTMRESQKKIQLLRSRLLLEIEKEQLETQDREVTECQKKFRALPVPAHVYLQLYEEMNEQNEERRRRGREKRKEFLMSTQKLFSFTEKEEEEKKENEKLKLQISEVIPETVKKAKPIKKIPLSVKDPTVSEKLKEEELFRKIRIQMRAADLLKSASSPINLHPYKKELARSSSMKTREEKLGFLEDEPKFKPRINPDIPDYVKLYKAFQREARRKEQVKEPTKCVPFELHTSKLAPRQSNTSEVVSKASHQKVKTHLNENNSFSGIHSLSSDTLPTYTTDAARKRHSAVRKSLEERDKQALEKAQWMEKYKMNTQGMSKTLLTRAKAMDPHQSLAETYKKTLKQYRQQDFKRKKEYMKEMEEMKRRVRSRPFLFEQVTQKNATSVAERRYRETLRQAGVDEEFVEDKGRNTASIPLTISDEEDNSFDSEDRENQESDETSEPSESIKPVGVDEENIIPNKDKGEEDGEQDDDPY
ncbi:protein FAM161B isoform X2 [Chiloscyllium punctatum]|uniref:protein FAM161B isoform X2 n=1 Tax=Chiloscyllium punctatum TaxID=137246 RepID=UPI003B63C641